MNYRKIAIKKFDKIKSSSKDSLLDELLSARNITKEKDIEKFLNPTINDFISPYAFLDMEKAKKRIKEAIEQKQKILIWGDFDCDGVTSSTVLFKALKELKANVLTFIPDRLLHGHGLNSKELLTFVSKENVKLVITVDCGISNIKEISLLKSLRVDTILTDHHSTDIELPMAYAIINPQVEGAINPELSADNITYLTYNSGSIVAYKLAMAILEDIDNKNLKDELLLIASCGAIADVVPLLGENRAMVKHALELINNKKEKSHLGIYKLLSKNIKDRDINSTDVAFILAPRINAVGRLANAKLSFDFLNEDNENMLDIIIEKLDSYNAIRQAKCAETYNEIKDYLKKNPQETKKPAVILMNSSWHIGIIGIVASKIVEEYNKPCFLMTADDKNNERCSIRSNDLINVYEILKENEELFLGFGGHKLAGGCSFDLSQKKFEDVKEALLKTINEASKDEKPDNTLYADIEVKAQDIDLGMLETIDKLEPFGQNNEPPLFAMFNVTLEEFKTIGKEQNHLRLILSCEDKKFQAVKWSETELLIPQGQKCDIAFYPRLNVFNDVKSVQFEIVDMYCEGLKKPENEYKIFDHRKKTGILEQISQYLEREGLDIAVWAKTISTKEILGKYQKIKDNFIEKINEHNGLMLFDYPSSIDELKEIIAKVKPSKIHLMNYKVDENLENYIKQALGMIKYCANHLQGAVEMHRLASALGVSENFLHITLEILENIGSINILDINKIEYIKPFNYADFKEDSMYELLKEEFSNILEFKKSLLNCDIKEFQQMLEI
ncbi:MAG: single-stranded-DNA-specific exonuclease RecJ [Candidatus Gastranaerophilales bacterium]|nr:single-stranded-DNA-specific exonuclease RecJ [Candidatus Gastranaerophilales bacterium]